MTDTDWIRDRRALLDAATEGPWVVGDRDHIQGASRCACRPEYGPLVWEGRRDINGVQMMTHIHRASEPRHDSDDTTIYSTSLPYPEIVALSTTEYVTIQPGDAALIADARTSLPKALDALEAVLELADGYDEGASELMEESQGDPVERWYAATKEAAGLRMYADAIRTAITEALGVES